MIPSERLHVHGNKQLLPRTKTDIFKTSFSFSGSLAWNNLAHHLSYPMELKTFKRKAFQPLAKPPWLLLYTSCSFLSFFFFLFLLLFFACQTTWNKMYRLLLLFSVPCSCKVLDLYFLYKKIRFCLLNFHDIFTLSFSWSFFLVFFFLVFLFNSNLNFAYMLVGVCDVLWF